MLKCSYKPTRTVARIFKERDAARILCRVVRSGGSKKKVDQLYERICLNQRPRRDEKSEAEIAMEIAITELANSNEDLDSNYRAFEIANGLIEAVVPLFKVLRVAKILQKAVKLFGKTQEKVDSVPPGLFSAKLGQIKQQIAANQDTMVILRQAASNEARFRMTGTR
jgi:hypothetical protein